MGVSVILGEYRDRNGKRNFPFADEASLKDDLDASLPTDFLIDAFLYPIDVQGAIYMSSINILTGKIYFSDTMGKTFGVATYVAGTDTAFVYETGVYARLIGVLVFGAGVTALRSGADVRSFTYAATALCPTTYVPVNSPGVQGFLLPDGSLVTGDVVITGRNGVIVQTLVLQSGVLGALTFDMEGQLAPTPDECGTTTCAPITQICFERLPGSMFSVSAYGTGIALSGYGFSQDDICAAQRMLSLPDSSGTLPPRAGADANDPCHPGPAPTPVDPGTAQSVCLDIATALGDIAISTPSAVGYLNPISVLGVAGAFNPRSFTQTLPVNSPADLANQIKTATNPPASSDSLKIGIKGLSTYRRRNA